MEQVYYDGLKNYVSQKVGSINSHRNADPVRYRVKVKEGVSSFALPDGEFLGAIWGIDYGLGGGVERSLVNNTPCGEYMTIFFQPGTNRFQNSLFIRGQVYSDFLSQFEIVYDCFPEYFGHSGTPLQPIVIDSIDFSAPSGLFDFYRSRVVFKGSTFKVGPKIYSDRVMREIQYFPYNPPASNLPYSPFEDCPNLEEIEYQGDFGEFLEFLGPCDFTYYDENGYGNLSAYPEGGSPIYIKRYVNATKIKFGEKFPQFSAERLENALEPFAIDEIVIGTESASIPFGGINYQEAPSMHNMWLYDSTFTIDIPFQSDENLSFFFSWGTLGITAPASCKSVYNLHKIYSNVPLLNSDVHIATPDYLMSSVNYSWGAGLRDFLESNPDSLTSDYMPKVPEDLKRVERYYEKEILGDRDEIARVSPYNSTSLLDEQKYNYTVPKLPEGIEVVVGYAKNLYAKQIVSTPISIPALPTTIRYLQDCYKRTFYNTIGSPVEITPEESEPSIFIAYSKSKSSGRPDIKSLMNPTEAYSGEFKELFDEDNFSTVIHRRNPFTDVIVGTESWSSFSEMLTDLKNPIRANIQDQRILSDIILEQSNINPEYNGNFQEDCFFASGANPTTTNLFVNTPASGEWNAYKRNLNVTNGVSYGKPNYYWTGTVRYDGGFFGDSYRMTFIIMQSYTDFTEEQFWSFKYDISEIISENIPPRVESANVLTPYNQEVNTLIIRGNYDNFMTENGIVLNDPGSFVQGADLGIDLGFTTSILLGWNAYRISTSDYTPGESEYYDFQGSYSRDEGRFGGNALIPNPDVEPPFITYAFNNPFWIDGMALGEVQYNSEVDTSTQSSITSLANTINGYYNP